MTQVAHLTKPEVRQAKEEIQEAGIQLLRFAEKKGVLTTAQFRAAKFLRWFEHPKDMSRAIEWELAQQKVQQSTHQKQVEKFRKQLEKAIQDRGIPVHPGYVSDAAQTEIVCRIKEYDYRGIYAHRTAAQAALQEHRRQLAGVQRRTAKQERLFNELREQIHREIFGEEPPKEITAEERKFLQQSLRKRLSEMKHTPRPPKPQPWGKVFA